MSVQYEIIVHGRVQGVGFRPYIYNACLKAGLKGFVQNTGNGVVVLVDKERPFRQILKAIPPLARIDSCTMSEVEDKGEGGRENTRRLEPRTNS